MKIGIMQPYFVPYIGYWQLMNAVDKYVVYDDVNYIKGGWINRNRILMNGKTQYFNVPMLGASPYKLINEVRVNTDNQLVKKNLRILEGAYKKAPYYNDIMPILEKVLCCGKENIAEYIKFSFYVINEYLKIDTELLMSSELDKDCTLKGQDKVISICKLLGATEYYNAIGGRELYSYADFKEFGIKLSFVDTDAIEYKQFGEKFYPNLSIIDVMMFNSRNKVRELLTQYQLSSGQ